MQSFKENIQVSILEDETSDEGLMVLVLNGDHAAFARLVRKHTQRFYAHAYRMSGSAALAEDIVQDCFLKLWQNPRAYDPARAKFVTWFYRVVGNAALDVRRGAAKMAPSDYLEEMKDDGLSAEQNMMMDESAARLEAAIQDLPERQRQALNLCVYEDVSNLEAARIMDIGVKALESLLSRAKASLKEKMTAHMPRDQFGKEQFQK